MTYYKVLVGSRSCFGGTLSWSLPTTDAGGRWTPGQWMHVTERIDLCRVGLHLTTEPYRRWVTWGMSVFEAEAGEIFARDRDKIVTSRARLLRPTPPPAWWAMAVRFVEVELPKIQWFQPDGAPDSSWEVFVAPSWEIAFREALAAAQRGLRSSKVDTDLAQTMQWTASTLRRAGRDIAAQVIGGTSFAEARKTAVEVVRSLDPETGPTREMANDAAEAAREYSVMHTLCSDEACPPNVLQPIAARWRAYSKGYIPVASVAERLLVCGKSP